MPWCAPKRLPSQSTKGWLYTSVREISVAQHLRSRTLTATCDAACRSLYDVETTEVYVDTTQPDLDALTTIIGALKRMSREEQSRTMQAVSVFLGLNTEPARTSLGTSVSPQIPRATQPTDNGSSFSEERGLSPKEFLRDKKPASDVERVACLAYYLTHHRDTPHFKTVDISALNTEAAQPKFSNASMAVDNATKAGLLVQASKGSKQLSASGEHYVQLLPNRDAARDMIKSSNVRRNPRRPMQKRALSSQDPTTAGQ